MCLYSHIICKEYYIFQETLLRIIFSPVNDEKCNESTPEKNRLIKVLLTKPCDKLSHVNIQRSPNGVYSGFISKGKT